MGDAADIADRIGDLLDVSDAGTVGTSMRIPAPLLEAASLAVDELGSAGSTTALTVQALRSRLEAIAMQVALDAHYEQHPEVRPDLADVAIAAVELDGHPLAARPELLREAAAAVAERHPEADADDVLLWAEARSLDAA